MEYKVVISDPEIGKSYQREIKDPEASQLKNKKIGEELPGKLVGLEGYKLKITGGSDRSGFPMKKGVHRMRKKILMKKGIGYKGQRGERKRKRVIGEVISDNITQINTKVVKRGGKSIGELLGIGEEKKSEGEKKEEKPEKKEKPEKEEAETKKEEKPKEEKPSMNWLKKDLKKYAKQHDIKIKSSDTKKDILKKIEQPEKKEEGKSS